jgi:hypothetical protein
MYNFPRHSLALFEKQSSNELGVAWTILSDIIRHQGMVWPHGFYWGPLESTSYNIAIDILRNITFPSKQRPSNAQYKEIRKYTNFIFVHKWTIVLVVTRRWMGWRGVAWRGHCHNDYMFGMNNNLYWIFI